jgi:glucose/arabinose dehydrogenase
VYGRARAHREPRPASGRSRRLHGGCPGRVSPAGATNFPTGFSDDVVASGLTEPTAISFFPDGRMAIAQKSGVVRLVKNGALQLTPLIDIEDRVNDDWDRGLIGIAVDPSFASNPYVYLLYVYENDPNDYTGDEHLTTHSRHRDGRHRQSRQ